MLIIIVRSDYSLIYYAPLSKASEAPIHAGYEAAAEYLMLVNHVRVRG